MYRAYALRMAALMTRVVQANEVNPDAYDDLVKLAEELALDLVRDGHFLGAVAVMLAVSAVKRRAPRTRNPPPPPPPPPAPMVN